MAAKKGQGSVRFRADKGLWCGQVSLGYRTDKNGKRKRVRKTFYGKTQQEVLDAMARLQGDILAGKPIPNDRLTVKQHFEDWLRSKKGGVARSTYTQYEGHVQTHIIPSLGRIKLKDLDYRRINAFYDELHNREDKLAPRTIYDIGAILRSGLEDAVRKGLVPSNQGKLAAKLSRGDKEARFLNPQELASFLEACKGERLENAFILAINTGMRPGEWLGLSWDAVDLQQGKLTVRQALHEVSGKVYLGDVKTKASRRTISLPKDAVQALRRQRKHQLEEQLASGGRWVNEENLVFTDTQGGLLRRTNVSKRDMKRIVRRADLEDATLHTFRHTHASLLIAAGVDIKTISRRLGHENITITLQTYGHLMPGQDERAADVMDTILAGLPSVPPMASRL